MNTLTSAEISAQDEARAWDTATSIFDLEDGPQVVHTKRLREDGSIEVESLKGKNDAIVLTAGCRQTWDDSLMQPTYVTSINITAEIIGSVRAQLIISDAGPRQLSLAQYRDLVDDSKSHRETDVSASGLQAAIDTIDLVKSELGQS